MFRKMKIFLFSSFLNIIIESVRPLVGWSVVSGSMVGRFNKGPSWKSYEHKYSKDDKCLQSLNRKKILESLNRF